MSNLNKEEILFYLYFIFILIGKSIGLGANNFILRIITIMAFIFLLIKLTITKYTRREIIIIAILIIIGMFTFYISKRAGVLLSILTIIGMKNIEYKKLFSLSLNIKVIIYFTIIFSSLIGMIPNKQYVHWRDGIGYITRYSLGYNHPNLLHSNLFIIVVLFIYLNYKKLNIINCSIILAVNFFIYNFSLSRTGFYSIIMIVIVSYILSRIKKHINYSIFKYIMPISVIFTFVTAKLYNQYEILYKLDNILTGRIFVSFLKLI
ncbi:hypothetical protein [Clostridium chauvoei]|uniref:Uncharacterized protein n=2 Tax=Clostridium chauvoei TaxID=46867 RepID=A0ABD4RF28_9CLOT|nr:hypothetical protein [Clostridium chauvoei]ATD54282.1 hypothetical protein BTM20_03140 [Clostridium chauvoei]ATD58035.1 hypothetical protein BTM21_09925 [Clostridium chauvoei]MBX7279889.1 hypothetical protein [Clostridium chauvoei]MBX7282193.1 hypothetical protein [Clostridium chauvoei]MBX7284779.1 hypothetical protein [Clostridium chauvoei]